MEHSPKPKLITTGSEVEVCSEEEGFSGAWFEATVVKKKKKGKVHVQYKALFADDDLSLPLREHVSLPFVRPLPPLSDNKTGGFDLYDVVDAAYKDGWWTGVITRIFEGSRFVVTFRNPDDELEFRGVELRLHFDWVNHAWVRPPKQRISGLMFSQGREVEVLVKINHNQDVWYPATVVENHDDTSFLVQYITFNQGTNETEPRKLIEDSSRIRPIPPLVKDRLFDLFEKVEVLNEFGWCAGVVTKALPDDRFTVFFQSSNRDGEFHRSDIRPQLNWKDGKWWFASSQEEVTPCEENSGVHVISELNDILSGKNCEPKVILKGENLGHKSPISSSSRQNNPWEKLSNEPCSRKGDLGADLEKTEFPSSCLGENQTDHLDLGHQKSHGVVSSPKNVKHSAKVTMHLEEKLKRGGDAVTPSCISHQKDTAMSDKRNGGIDSTSGTPPSNITGENMLIDLTGGDQHSDYPSLGMRIPKKQKKMDGKENHMLNSRRKPRQACEEYNNDFTKLAEHVETDSRGKKDDATFTSLECCNLSGSKARKTCLNNGEECLQLEGDQEKQLNDLPMPDKGDQPEAEKISYKRKRGRPRKVFAGSLKAEMTEQVRYTANDDIIIKDSTMSEVDSQVAPDSMLMSMEGLLPAENSLMPIGDCINLFCAQLNQGDDSGSMILKSSSRMPTDGNYQAKQRANENQISQISDSSKDPIAKPAKPLCITKEVIDSSNAQNHVLVDRDTMVEQSAEVRQPRTELNGQAPSSKDSKTVAVISEEVNARSLVLVEGKTSLASTGEPELPFVKSSSLWKEIESMEAFRKMPQKPHFRPLQQYKESSREGFAIAFMVNFSTAVEKISWLRFDDTKQKIDDILDSLDDLESHGFEVQILRDKISEMESIKENHKKLHEEVDVINKQIVSCNFDKADQEKEISEVSKQVKELQERIAKAQSMKEMKDGEIAALESRRKEVEETIRSARGHYEGLASGVM